MHDIAQSIRAAEARGEFAPLTSPVSDEYDGAAEGRLLIRRYVAYERNRALRRRKLDEVRNAGRPLACEVCGFGFEATYGERGNGYIECHHIMSLHVSRSARTKLTDLPSSTPTAIAIHVRPPWLTPAELADLTRRQAT